MKLYLCSVKLGDSNNHVVPNKPVTIPEIAVLRRIHGDAAVTDIRPYKVDGKDQMKLRDGRPITDAEERERLAQRYQRGEEAIRIDALFGAMGALPKSLREIGIDPARAAADLHKRAEEMAAAAASLVEDDLPPAADEDDFFDEPETAPAGKKAA